MGFVPFSTRSSYSSFEAQVRTVLGEAGNQGYTGQLAVAAVMQNRDAAGNFPSNLTPSQFNGFNTTTPVGSSSYNQAAQAVTDAQNGSDPTGGATYFANPGASQASWARNLNENNSLKIGDHYFTDNTNGVPFSGNDAEDNAADQGYDNAQGSGSTFVSGSGQTPPQVYAAPGTFNPETGASLDPGNVAPQSVGQTRIDSAGVTDGGTLPEVVVDTSNNTTGGTGAGTSGFSTMTYDQYMAQNSGVSASATAGQTDGAATGGVSGNNQLAGLPGPLQSILGGSSSSSSGGGGSGMGAIISGPWDFLGTTAVTTGANTQAQAAVSAANTQAAAIKDAASQTNKTNAQDTKLLTDTSTSNTNNAIKAGETTTNTFLDNIKDIFVRGWIGFFGIVLLAGAIYYFMRQHDAIPSATSVIKKVA